MAGSLSGSNATSTTAVNLSSPAQTDWIQFPQNITSPNRKSGGGSTISLPSPIGPESSYGAGSSLPRGITWTDGTPSAAATGDSDYVYAPSSGGTANVGDGLQFTLPADTNVRVATIAWSLYGGQSGPAGATAQLVATLSDGSAAPVTLSPVTPGVGGQDCYVSTITYNAASAGQTLTIALTLANNATNQWANITLQAASYLVNSGLTLGLTGNALTGNAGSVGAALGISATGNAASGAPGNVGANGSAVAALSGNAATGAVGNVGAVVSTVLALTGTVASGSVGNIGISKSSTIALSGVSGQCSVGYVNTPGGKVPEVDRIYIIRSGQSAQVTTRLP